MIRHAIETQNGTMTKSFRLDTAQKCVFVCIKMWQPFAQLLCYKYAVEIEQNAID